MSEHVMTAEEFFESLTGFDEMAIKRAFGAPVVALSQEDQMTFARSLVFVAKRRDGASDNDAKEAALSMPLGQVTGFFADDDEAMVDDPDTESGKDD